MAIFRSEGENINKLFTHVSLYRATERRPHIYLHLHISKKGKKRTTETNQAVQRYIGIV